VGAVEDNYLVKQMGNAIGEQAKTLGVNFNFAPVVDVNTNPQNPIIGNRSFGSDVENVAQKGINYMLGMKEKGVLASAKHFPGHGDTSTDSHKTLPTVDHDLTRLKSVELAPFQKLIDAGVPAIMVAHLNVPALDNSGLPTTLSKKVVTDLLKNEMHFKGLIVTDALNMDGVAKTYPPGEVDARAFEAGNDILLFSQAVKTGKQKIIAKINSGEISEERLAESVKKILMAKYFVGLHNSKPIDTKDLISRLNSPSYQALTSKLYENAATLIKNESDLLPIKNLAETKIAFVPLEEAEFETFHQNLNFHVQTDLVRIKSVAEVSKLKDYDYVIIGFHKSNETAYKSYKISANSNAILKAASAQNNTIAVVFGSPYGLMDLDLTSTKAALVMYQNLDMTQNAAAGIIFGAIGAKGKLPVDVNAEWKYGKSLKTESLQRLGFSVPEAVGLKPEILSQLDNLAQKAIDEGTTPGLQLVVAKNGKVIYDKSFGYQTIERKKKVSDKDLYDLASVTKITVTLPLLMQEV